MATYDYNTPPIGEQFNRLVVLSYSHNRRTASGDVVHYWRCRCRCGMERSFPAYDVLRGRTKSCGCLQKEGVSKRWLKHGECGQVEYVAWQNMKSRCLNSKNREYPNYGQRGITICQGWLEFPVFLRDIGRRPNPLLSIDRINNDGHYSCGKCSECVNNGWPMNIRWATASQQTQNRRGMSSYEALKAVRTTIKFLGIVDAAIRIRRGLLLCS
jgi:hypothetical protein